MADSIFFLYETKVDQGMSLVNWELIICQIGIWISHNSYYLWVAESLTKDIDWIIFC